MSYNFEALPWIDSKTWDPKKWYPMPTSYLSEDQDEMILDGYCIFQLDPEVEPGGPLFGDIIPVVGGNPMIFTQALEICEHYNGCPLFKEKA